MAWSDGATPIAVRRDQLQAPGRLATITELTRSCADDGRAEVQTVPWCGRYPARLDEHELFDELLELGCVEVGQRDACA